MRWVRANSILTMMFGMRYPLWQNRSRFVFNRTRPIHLEVLGQYSRTRLIFICGTLDGRRSVPFNFFISQPSSIDFFLSILLFILLCFFFKVHIRRRHTVLQMGILGVFRWVLLLLHITEHHWVRRLRTGQQHHWLRHQYRYRHLYWYWHGSR